MNVVYFSRFLPKRDGDGGSRRLMQIFDLFGKYDCRIITAAEKNEYTDLPVNLRGLKNAQILWDDVDFKIKITGQQYYKWSESFRDWLFYMRYCSYKWAGLIEDGILPVDLALIDDPMYFAPLVDKLNELKIPIIGNAHNIETHVVGQIIVEHQYELFKNEIEYLKKCDLVITISHEDTIVLNNFGVNTVLWEYYPVKEQEELFCQIRQDRKQSQKTDWLLMGTAHNIPTRDGMVDIINFWLSSKKLVNERLFVVGFGTEKLEEIVGFRKTNSIEILGSVEADQLLDRLVAAKGVILYQKYGTGALTKIQELLIAGVPVFANHHAARSYHLRPGVNEYYDFSDLDYKINELNSTKLNDIPLPLRPDESLFHKRITQIVKDISEKPGSIKSKVKSEINGRSVLLSRYFYPAIRIFIYPFITLKNLFKF